MRDKFNDTLGEVGIDWLMWTRQTLHEVKMLVVNRKIHPAALVALKQAIDANQEMMEERTQAAEAYLARLGAAFQERGLEVETRVAHGPVVEEIINRAERSKVDLIAMASHGRTGLSRVFYGSVAAGVLNKVDRPLFLVRSSNNG